MIIVTRDHTRLREPGYEDFVILDENADAEEFLENHYPRNLSSAWVPWTIKIITPAHYTFEERKQGYGIREETTYNRERMAYLLRIHQEKPEDHIIQITQTSLLHLSEYAVGIHPWVEPGRTRWQEFL